MKQKNWTPKNRFNGKCFAAAPCYLNVCPFALGKQLLFVYKVLIFSCDWIHVTWIAPESSIPDMVFGGRRIKALTHSIKWLWYYACSAHFIDQFFFVCAGSCLGLALNYKCIVLYNVCVCKRANALFRGVLISWTALRYRRWNTISMYMRHRFRSLAYAGHLMQIISLAIKDGIKRKERLKEEGKRI